jgi:UDP-2,3-diacylglucosamine hydrolase
MTLPCLQAPAAWQRIDFISDLHLDAGEPATFEAWAQHMAHTPADALFILGDLFEVWVGDDNPDPFAQQCVAVLQATAQRMPLFFMCGNRDFLVGHKFLNATGVQGLSDPTVLDVGMPTADANPLRMLLSHGDALCLDDHDYLTFRAQVRAPAWQSQFLAQPLAERQAYARQVRQQSEARKHSQATYADVDTRAALDQLHEANAQVMIHGHTHRPAEHALGAGLCRWVLSDWDATATPARLEVLSWLRQQAQSPTRGLCRLALAHK